MKSQMLERLLRNLALLTAFVITANLLTVLLGSGATQPSGPLDVDSAEECLRNPLQLAYLRWYRGTSY